MNALLRTATAGVAIATLGVATSASAATTASADAQAEILTALSVTVDATDDTLDFGKIADGGINTAQSLVVRATDGGLVSCPTGLICSGPTNAPTFNVAGLANKDVYIRFVNATETLSIPAASVPAGMVGAMTLGSFTLAAPTLSGIHVTTNASGAASFTVGGTLTVQPSQAPGVYTGTVSVNVAYN